MIRLGGLNAPQPVGESGSSFFRKVIPYQDFIYSARSNGTNLKNKGNWQVLVQPPAFMYAEITNRLAHTIWVEIDNNFGGKLEFMLERNQVKSLTSPVSLYNILLTDITQNPNYISGLSREERAVADRRGSTIYDAAVNVPNISGQPESANIGNEGGAVIISTSSVPIMSAATSIVNKPPTNYTQEIVITANGVGAAMRAKDAILNASTNNVASAGMYSGFFTLNGSTGGMVVIITPPENEENINPPIAKYQMHIPAGAMLYHPLECAELEIQASTALTGQSVIGYQSVVYYGSDVQTLF